MQELKPPIIILNFKTYQLATGGKAVKLAKIAEKISAKRGIYIAVAPQTVDIYRVSKSVKIPVYAQHIDPLLPGRNTGYITAYAVKSSGATGAILNHAEHPLLINQIEEAIRICRENKLITCVCSRTYVSSRSLAVFKPDMVAFEPPELIATDRSVSTTKPESLRMAIEGVKAMDHSIHVLCGAGIRENSDVVAALKLGAEGVLLSSGFVKARNPENFLKKLTEELNV